MMKKIEKSFYDWCIENNKQDILDRIDYNLTDIDIRSIGYSSKISWIYLKCPDGKHESEKFRIHNITNKYRNNKCTCKKCKDIFELNFENLSKYCLERNSKLIEIDRRFNKSGNVYVWLLLSCENSDHDPYWMLWSNFKSGKRCNQCYCEKNTITDWNLIRAKEFFATRGLFLIDEKEFRTSQHKVNCMDDCGFKYYTSIEILKSCNIKPDRFSSYNPHTINNIRLFCKLYRQDYEFISENYINCNTKYLWKYNGEFYKNDLEIDRKFYCSVDNFINAGTGHPLLTRSKLELITRRILDKNNVGYVTEKTFPNCKDKIVLRFDFYLQDKCGKYVLIETDGFQHEIPVECWGGMTSLQDRIKKDNIKNQYCSDNNIKLIRISQKNINHIEEVLRENNII